jgi:predicted dehydrogenase
VVYRAALIGCGAIGSTVADDPFVQDVYSHAGAYTACPRTALVAVCDTDQDRLSRSAAKWGVRSSYADAAAMLSAVRPDIVSICTPDATHLSLLNLALQVETVRAVLVEKPIGLDLERAHQLVQLARQRGVALAVNYIRRYATNHRSLHDWIGSGSLGRLQAVSGLYTKGTLHNGTHWFDLLRLLAGEVAEVSAIDVLQEGGPDPTLDVTMRMTDGSIATLRGCSANKFSIFEMDLVGTAARVRIVDSGHLIERYVVGESTRYTGYQALRPIDPIPGPMTDTTLHALNDLVNCIDSGASPRCSGDDGLAALRVAMAARQSAAEQKSIALEPVLSAIGRPATGTLN